LYSPVNGAGWLTAGKIMVSCPVEGYDCKNGVLWGKLVAVGRAAGETGAALTMGRVNKQITKVNNLFIL